MFRRSYRSAEDSRNFLPVTDKVLLKLLKGDKIDLKPIKGTEDTFRIRIGSFRILIKKIKEDKVYLVFKIGARGDIYQDL